MSLSNKIKRATKLLKEEEKEVKAFAKLLHAKLPYESAKKKWFETLGDDFTTYDFDTLWNHLEKPGKKSQANDSSLGSVFNRS